MDNQCTSLRRTYTSSKFGSSDNVNVRVDALWETLNRQARTPKTLKNVSDVKASDEDGFLRRGVKINARKLGHRCKSSRTVRTSPHS